MLKKKKKILSITVMYLVLALVVAAGISLYGRVSGEEALFSAYSDVCSASADKAVGSDAFPDENTEGSAYDARQMCPAADETVIYDRRAVMGILIALGATATAFVLVGIAALSRAPGSEKTDKRKRPH